MSDPGATAPTARTTHATVLFADVVGFTDLAERVGPEPAYFAVTGALRVLDGVARRHGGAVDKYLGDCLMAVFGHPVPVADDAAAAATAAVEMRERFDEYRRGVETAGSLALVVGVNTGTMVAGDVRGGAVREFHVLGDAVNVAARLKARAPRGAIYVGPETHRRTAEAFEYAALGGVKLKGKTAEVPIFELLRSSARRSGPGVGAQREATGAFVGRAAELAVFAARLDALAGGRGGVVLLVGDEGIGKSRLLAAVEALPQAARVRIVHARAASGADVKPRQVFADLLEACGEAAAGADVGERLMAALRRLAAERPLVVVLEDLQRADPASIDLLPTVVARLDDEAILFIVTARPEPAAGAAQLRRALARSPLVEVPLAPLSDAESRAVVDAIADAAMSEESRQMVLARAGGHPARLVTGTFLEPALRAERERASTVRQRSDEAERRRATILFADITGFTSLTERLGAERAYPVVVGCLRLLDEVARKHGGTVDKYLGDCVMALFGVPEAIEDAPRAAVNASIEMRRSVRAYCEGLGEEVRLDVHSGINTGTGIAGDISGPLIREFAVMGDPVSVADELKDLAPAGHVYVGAEVYRATRDVFEYREVDEGERTQRGAPLGAFELLSQQERLHRARIGAGGRVFSSLVGRDEELAQLRAALGRLAAARAELRAALERVRQGEGGVVSVIAAAGLGKSRLLAELAATEEARTVGWYEGRSLSAARHLGFHTIADLCRSIARIDEGADDAHARRQLDAAVARLFTDANAIADVEPYLAKLVGVPLDAATAARVAELRGDALEKLTVRSVTSYVRAESRRLPMVVVLDDLHWADVSSVELLATLLHACADDPVLFVLLFRPGFAETSERLREGARGLAARYAEIELLPLDASACRQMLNNLFRRGELPSATRRLIEEKARGNPFYIEEVIRALVDAGAVEYVDGAFRATDAISGVVIPGSIQELVMARVDRLELDKRQLLQTASVLGVSFHVDVLGEVTGRTGRLADDLRALVNAEFLVDSERLPGREYAFKHPLIQEVTYDGLLQTRRETLHRRVGEAMERVLTDDVPGYAGMLAYHYGKGGAVERAEAFLFRAGAEAARAAAPSEALHFFEEASKLYLQLHADGGDPAKRALLEKNIAQALYYRGRFLEAIEHFNLALRLLGDRVVEGRVALARSFVANLVAVLARLYVPRVGRRPRAASDREREIMELRYARAEATVTSQPTRHLFDSMDSLAFLQRIDPTSVPGSGKFYAGAAALFAFGGISFSVSRRLSDQARALVPPDAPDEYLYERAMAFTFRVLEGDWDDVHEIEPARIAASVRNGQLWGPTTYLGLLAEKYIHRGELDRARECVAQIDEIWEVFQYDLAKTNHYYLHTLLPLELGDLETAMAAADAYYDENPEDLLHILALGAKAKAQVELGDLDAAEETLRQSAEVVARSAPVPPFHGSCHQRSRLLLDVARLARAVAEGDATERRRCARRARRSARAALRGAAKVAWRRVEVLRLVGRQQWLSGKHARAVRTLVRAVECGERLGAAPETARTWAELGRWLSADGRAGVSVRGRDGAACLAHARETFARLGLTRDLDRMADL